MPPDRNRQFITGRLVEARARNSRAGARLGAKRGKDTRNVKLPYAQVGDKLSSSRVGNGQEKWPDATTAACLPGVVQCSRKEIGRAANGRVAVDVHEYTLIDDFLWLT